jgi:hypothetical protein
MDSECESYTTFHSEAATDIIEDFDELIELYATNCDNSFHEECLYALEDLNNKISDQGFLKIIFRDNDNNKKEEDFMDFLERLHVESIKLINSGELGHVTFGEKLLDTLTATGTDIF